MSNYCQLYMKKASLADLPALTAMLGPLPANISLHTHRPGDAPVWEKLMERCFQMQLPFERHMRSQQGYAPDRVFYLTREGAEVASAAAVENPAFPNDGWLHFVGVDPAAQGLGLGKHIVLAALYAFYARGYQSIVLSTDDFRIPAIKCYLRLGFVPMPMEDAHVERWQKVMAQIGG